MGGTPKEGHFPQSRFLYCGWTKFCSWWEVERWFIPNPSIPTRAGFCPSTVPGESWEKSQTQEGTPNLLQTLACKCPSSNLLNQLQKDCDIRAVCLSWGPWGLKMVGFQVSFWLPNKAHKPRGALTHKTTQMKMRCRNHYRIR